GGQRWRPSTAFHVRAARGELIARKGTGRWLARWQLHRFPRFLRELVKCARQRRAVHCRNVLPQNKLLQRLGDHSGEAFTTTISSGGPLAKGSTRQRVAARPPRFVTCHVHFVTLDVTN